MNPRETADLLEIDSIGRLILTVSAISLNFDYVTSDPTKSRADEIRVLLVKNKKPSRKSKEGKPGGFGLPTGQVEGGFDATNKQVEISIHDHICGRSNESCYLCIDDDPEGEFDLGPKLAYRNVVVENKKESMDHAVERETEHETGYAVKKIVGKAFVVYKRHINNEIHVHIIESHDLAGSVRERDEIDATIDPWFSLRQAFELPLAQSKDAKVRNPDGLYFSHRQRLFRAIDSMLLYPDSLVDSGAITKWLTPNRDYLESAMLDLENAGLLRDFLPDESGFDDSNEHASS